MSAGEGENYNSISSTVSTVLYFLGIEHNLETLIDTRFIKGRAAKIIVKGKEVGIFGEIHPQVLTNRGIEVPVVVAEFNIDKLRELK